MHALTRSLIAHVSNPAEKSKSLDCLASREMTTGKKNIVVILISTTKYVNAYITFDF